MRTSLAPLILCLLVGSGGFAQEWDWAKAMFDHTSHDFGVLARGAQAEHRFTVENLYLEDMRIDAVHSSCKCISAEFSKEPLKTYEKAEIVVKVDTRRFLGRKDATLRVIFPPPFKAEVQLHVYCYIRSDVVFQPGVVQFGSVDQGTSARRKVTVSYAGRSDWQILQVRSAQPYLETKVNQLSRSLGQVVYELWVELKDDAPVGYIRDHLTVVTNDRNPDAARVPLAVEGLVIAAMSASPSPLRLGELRIGQAPVTRNLVVHGKRPFRIVNVSCPDERFRFTVSDAAKPVHLIPVTFTAGETPGEVTGEIRIQTDLDDNKLLEVKVEGLVLPQSPETGDQRPGTRAENSESRTLDPEP